jgi:hypothetical protein
MLHKLYVCYLAISFSFMPLLLALRTAYAQDTALTSWSRVANLDHRAEGDTALIFFLVAAVLIVVSVPAAYVVKTRRERRRTALARRLMQMLY